MAAERLYINFTPVLRNAVGRKVLPRITGAIDPGVAQAFAEIVDDPRLAPQRTGVTPGCALRRILAFCPAHGRPHPRAPGSKPAAERGARSRR